mmetsp:Transcript_46240/g.110873  ORF Transcript_46240/g.110873 Transcript_46240/m.110873 type:complete len:200 (-) Transcript_46240:128-727(-)
MRLALAGVVRARRTLCPHSRIQGGGGAHAVRRGVDGLPIPARPHWRVQHSASRLRLRPAHDVARAAADEHLRVRLLGPPLEPSHPRPLPPHRLLAAHPARRSGVGCGRARLRHLRPLPRVRLRTAAAVAARKPRALPPLLPGTGPCRERRESAPPPAGRAAALSALGDCVHHRLHAAHRPLRAPLHAPAQDLRCLHDHL